VGVGHETASWDHCGTESMLGTHRPVAPHRASE